MDRPLPRRLVRSRSCQLTVFVALILFLLSIGLVQAPATSSKMRGLVHSSAFRKSRDCGALHPTQLDPNGPISKTWTQLHQLFESHAPGYAHVDGPTSAKPNLSSNKVVKMPLPSTVPEASILRSIHEDLVTHIPSQPPSDLFHGRGIVMMGGEGKDEYAATSLGVLRLLGSRLPVELWYLDSSFTKPGWCQELAGQGIACRFLSDYVTNATAFFPYQDQGVAAALLFSSFADMLYLDAYTLPVMWPDDIFDSQPYRDRGVVTWPDFWSSAQSPWTDYITGFSGDLVPKFVDHGTIDAAQFMLNKNRHWKALNLLLYYNYHAPFYHLLLDPIPNRSFPATLATSLRALAIPPAAMAWLTPVPLSSPDGSPVGGGVTVLQVSPLDPERHLFLHTSIVRFSLRELMCDKSCIEARVRPTDHQRIIGTSVRTMGAVVTKSDSLYGHLTGHRRLLAWKMLWERGIDPERGIWMVLERLACEEEGAWFVPGGGVCENVRGYVNGTFEDWRRWRGECVEVPARVAGAQRGV